jgi:hypothetical protein
MSLTGQVCIHSAFRAHAMTVVQAITTALSRYPL